MKKNNATKRGIVEIIAQKLSVVLTIVFLLMINVHTKAQTVTLEPVTVWGEPGPEPDPWEGIGKTVIQCPCYGSLGGGGFNFPMYRWLSTFDKQNQILNAFSVDNLAKQVQNLAANSGTKCVAPKVKVNPDGSKDITCSAVFGEIDKNQSVTIFRQEKNTLDLKFENGNNKLSIGSDATGRMSITTPDFQSASNVTYDYNNGGKVFKLSVDPNTGNGTITLGTTGASVAFTGTATGDKIEFSKTFAIGGTTLEVKGDIGRAGGNFDAIGLNFNLK